MRWPECCPGDYSIYELKDTKPDNVPLFFLVLETSPTNRQLPTPADRILDFRYLCAIEFKHPLLGLHEGLKPE